MLFVCLGGGVKYDEERNERCNEKHNDDYNALFKRVSSKDRIVNIN